MRVAIITMQGGLLLTSETTVSGHAEGLIMLLLWAPLEGSDFNIVTIAGELLVLDRLSVLLIFIYNNFIIRLIFLNYF